MVNFAHAYWKQIICSYATTISYFFCCHSNNTVFIVVAKFDAEKNYVTFPNSGQLNYYGSNTIAFWIYILPQTGTGVVFAQYEIPLAYVLLSQ